MEKNKLLVVSKNIINVNIGNARYIIQSGEECYFDEYKQGGITLVGWGNHVFNLKDFEPVDLTKIGKPFGELDRETQKELLAAYYLDKKLLQFRGSDRGYWVDGDIVNHNLTFSSTVHYRLKPEKSPEQLQKESLQKKVEELQKEINSIVVPE